MKNVYITGTYSVYVCMHVCSYSRTTHIRGLTCTYTHMYTHTVPEHTEGNDSDDEADDGQSTSNVGQHNQSSFNCRILQQKEVHRTETVPFHHQERKKSTCQH